MTDAIGSPPPADVADELKTLAAKLDQVIPAKELGRNLLVGTWNLRDFDRVTSKWRSVTGDSPIRDLSNVACIAEIVRRFDVVAVQEVRKSAQALTLMMQALGEGWAFLVTDVTRGPEGNQERLAFVFDSRRVHPSGLACELVVAAENAGISEDVLTKQFAWAPYGVSFASGSAALTLVTLHVTYGQGPQDRVAELKEIALWLSRWAEEGDPWGGNLIALGDFNIDRKDDPLYQAFTSTGLRPPDTLNYVPRKVFDDPDPKAAPNHAHFYDQIAWFTGDQGAPVLSLGYRNAGMFEFTGGLIPATDTKNLSWRISDHFPFGWSSPPADSRRLSGASHGGLPVELAKRCPSGSGEGRGRAGPAPGETR
jgi:endonuclease/exonuclease/phosphatase family metal-dependent hydrolase